MSRNRVAELNLLVTSFTSSVISSLMSQIHAGNCACCICLRTAHRSLLQFDKDHNTLEVAPNLISRARASVRKEIK